MHTPHLDNSVKSRSSHRLVVLKINYIQRVAVFDLLELRLHSESGFAF